jgi:hypothetical protein
MKYNASDYMTDVYRYNYNIRYTATTFVNAQVINYLIYMLRSILIWSDPLQNTRRSYHGLNNLLNITMYRKTSELFRFLSEMPWT